MFDVPQSQIMFLYTKHLHGDIFIRNRRFQARLIETSFVFYYYAEPGPTF